MKKSILSLITRVFLSLIILISFIISPLEPQAKTANTLRELREELSALQAKKKSNEQAKKSAENEIKEKNQAIYNAYNEIEVAKNKIEEAKLKIEESQREITSVTEETEEIIRVMQIMNGENAYLEYISGSESITEMVMRMSAVDQISDYNREQLQKLENLIKENEQLQVDMNNYQNTLNENIVKYEKRIDTLDSKLEDLAEVTEDIDDQIKNQKKLIDYYVSYGCKEDEDLTKCVSVANNAGWLKPLKKAKVTSLWGYRTHPVSGVYKFHNGIDLAGNSEGTNVYAAASGTVAAVTYKSSCGGNKVYIHSYVNGVAYTTYYFHLLSINVKVGDAVTPDTVIATVGGGNKTKSYDKCSTGAHLHFGVSKGFYLGGGKEGYSSYNTLVSKSINPPGFPGKGVWFYSRTQWFN